MSATLSYSISLTHRITDGSVMSIQPVSVSKTVSENHVSGIVTIASASATAFPLGTVTTPLVAYIYNMDDTNFITVIDDSTDLQIDIPAGEPAIIPLSSGLTTLKAQADTADCEVYYAIFEAA